MGELFVRDKIIGPSVISADSTLIKTKGHVWQKSSMTKEIVPHSGTDTDARWDSVIQRVGYLDTNYI